MLVKLKFRLRLKTLKKPKSRTSYDFKQSDQNDQYRLELSNKFQLLAELSDSENEPHAIETDTEQLWEQLKVSVLESAGGNVECETHTTQAAMHRRHFGLKSGGNISPSPLPSPLPSSFLPLLFPPLPSPPLPFPSPSLPPLPLPPIRSRPP